MAVPLLDDWCKGMDLDPRKAVLIVGIPVQYTEAQITDALKEGLPPLCAHKVIGRMFRREDKAKAVLIELSDTVNYTMMPTHIEVEGGAWEVVVKPRSPDDEFVNKLICFLREEGRRTADLVRVLGSISPAVSMELRNLCQTKVEGSNSLCYRKLKVFSGSPFPGPGEETFETWLREITEMMQVWQLSEMQKKQLLLESLRGYALSIIQALWAGNVSLTAEQCLKGLKQVFGGKEDYKVFQFRFLLSSQKPTEKISDYLLRLEPLLQRAVRQSPFSDQSADSIRLKHVLSQVSMTPGLRSKLALLDQRGYPPTFLELIKLTRDEEEWEATRVVIKEQENQEEKAAVAASIAAYQGVTQAGIFREVSTQTTGEEMTPVKRRRLLRRHSAGEEGYMKESDIKAENESDEQSPQVRVSTGVGKLERGWDYEPPQPQEHIGSRYPRIPSSGWQERYLDQIMWQPRQMAGDMSDAEECQGPSLLLARNDFNRQEQASSSQVTTKSQAHGECQRQEWEDTVTRLEEDSDSTWDSSEDNDGNAGGPRQRMPTGTKAAQDMEEDATGSSWPGESSAWEQVQQGSETVPRRGVRKIQPVLRIIYTALGEPHEGSTLESFYGHHRRGHLKDSAD